MSERLIQTLALPLQPLVHQLLDRARGEGLSTLIPSTGAARTSAEQMVLYSLGRHHDDSGRWVYNDPVTRLGVVTNALPNAAPHCHAAAVDVLLLDRGRVMTLGPEVQPLERARQLASYCALGRIGEELGLEWGGRWSSIHDYPHFQLPNWREFPVT